MTACRLLSYNLYTDLVRGRFAGRRESGGSDSDGGGTEVAASSGREVAAMATATSSLDLLDRQRMLNNFDAAVYGVRPEIRNQQFYHTTR